MAQPQINHSSSVRNTGSECLTCPAQMHCYSGAVPREDLDALAHLRRNVRFERKQTIDCARDPALYLFNVVSGTVKLIRSSPDGRAQIVGFRSQGGFFTTPEFVNGAIKGSGYIR